ncbi:MAG TPA: FecR domain-containing protein [Terriglobales bacterium]|nr:FecR domain-containing protein [Terriglobales bacterium]
MKSFNRHPDIDLERAVAELRNDSLNPHVLQAAADRVWQRLQEEQMAAVGASMRSTEIIRGCHDIRALLPAFHQGTLSAPRKLLVQDHLRECVSCREHAYGRRDAAETTAGWQIEPVRRHFAWLTPSPRSALAMCLLIAAIGIAWLIRDVYFSPPAGARAHIESVEGQLYRVAASGERALTPGDEIAEGDFIRTGSGSHAFVRLLDGSRVEMNQRAEFSVTAGHRDTAIHLDQGSIIVQAAKRQTGHLYVKAPDCRVAVTGTVFAVNSGTKGSRVSVIEGEVRVAHDGAEDVLHPGDQVSTTSNVSYVPISDEIAWSRNLDQHLALLAEFSKLRKQLEQIPAPSPRYESRILPLLPAKTVIYVSIPNLGQTLADANQVFQQQMSQSPVLRQWWQEKHAADHGPAPEELVEKIRGASQYLGDEVVFTATLDSALVGHGPVMLAQIRQPGLKDYLQKELPGLAPNNQAQNRAPQVVDQQVLATLSPTPHEGVFLVRDDFLVAGDLAAVRAMDAQLTSGGGGFSFTDFGQRVMNAYSRGAGFLIAADLGQLATISKPHAPSPHADQERLAFQNSGFSDVKYLIVELRQVSGTTDNRAVLEFKGERRGIASWLAAPAPMGSLDFVSADAGAAVSFLSKSPALMLDDLLNTFGATDTNSTQNLSKAEQEMGLRIREDLAATLGGDVTLALDGPVLPTLSWKVIAEVTDPAHLQNSIATLVQSWNQHAVQQGRPGVTLQQSEFNGRTFYTITSQHGGMPMDHVYTFSDGYLIMAPTRALVIAALNTHVNGTSLARSGSFRALLPKDGHNNFSALFYQNLAPILQPLLGQLTPQQQVLVQQLAADSRPTVICAYGVKDQIQLASTSRFFGFDLNTFVLSSLLKRNRAGTLAGPEP